MKKIFYLFTISISLIFTACDRFYDHIDFYNNIDEFNEIRELFASDELINVIWYEDNESQIKTLYFKPITEYKKERMESPSDNIEIYSNFLKKYHRSIGQIEKHGNSIRFQTNYEYFSIFRFKYVIRGADMGFLYNETTDPTTWTEKQIREAGYTGFSKTPFKNWYAYVLSGSIL